METQNFPMASVGTNGPSKEVSRTPQATPKALKDAISLHALTHMIKEG